MFVVVARSKHFTPKFFDILPFLAYLITSKSTHLSWFELWRVCSTSKQVRNHKLLDSYFSGSPLRATGDNLSHLNSLTTLIGTWCCVQWLHHLSIELIPKATEINSSYMSHLLMVKSMWYVFVSMFLTITAALSGVVRLAVLRLQSSGWWTPHRFMTSLSLHRSFQHWPAGLTRRGLGAWGWKCDDLLSLLSLHQNSTAQFTCIHCQLERCMDNVILLRGFQWLWLQMLFWTLNYT